MAAVIDPSASEQMYAPRRLVMQWHLTERCNLRCTHCYQEAVRAPELPPGSWLRILEQYEAFLADTGARGQITLTGGEPFVMRDLPVLLERIASQRQHYGFAILTNGTLIDAALAQRLSAWGVRFVQVSIDGDRATHDRIRGAGNFDRALAGVGHLVRAGVPTYLSFTAHRQNFRQFPEIARLGRELGVARVWSDRLIPQGQGTELQDQLLSPVETREFIQLMAQARAKVSGTGCTEVAMNRALQFQSGQGQPYHCTAGDTLITVMPNGDLYPCRRLPIRVGNLLETPLEELYQCDLFRALRDRTGVCQGCEGCLYAHLCGGGLHCLAYAVTGGIFRSDPGCWLASEPEVEGVMIGGRYP